MNTKLNIKKWLLPVAIVAGLAATQSVVADSDLAANLRAEADRIELDQKRSIAMQSLVNDILADSDSRTSFQGDTNPVTVNVHGFTQFRYSYDGGGDAGVSRGFSMPRTRLILDGEVYGVGYKISGQWDDGHSFDLKDAYIDVSGFRVGQFKSPFLREYLVAQTDTLMADRSIVSHQFGQGRSQGVQYGWDTDVFDLKVAYTDGFHTANGAGVQNGQSFTGRVTANLTDWWNVGAAASWNDLVSSNYTTYTVDTEVSVGDLDVNAAWVATNQEGSNWGATVQVGYQCTDNLQGYVAYEHGELEAAADTLSTLTVGANYWLNDNVKWTTDFGYALTGIDSAWATGDTGWNAGDSGEYLIRTQLQVQF